MRGSVVWHYCDKRIICINDYTITCSVCDKRIICIYYASRLCLNTDETMYPEKKNKRHIIRNDTSIRFVSKFFAKEMFLCEHV